MSSTPRPKRLSSIKALEDIQDISSSNTRKPGAKPRASTSFVFLDEEEASVASSASNGEEEEEDSRPKPTPRKSRTTPKKQAATSLGNANSLFASLQRAKANTNSLAAGWILRSNERHEDAIVDLLQLFCQGAGMQPPAAGGSVKFKKNASVTLNLICTAPACVFSPSCLIVGKNTEQRRFQTNFAQFFYELGRAIRGGGGQAAANRESVLLAAETAIQASLCSIKPQIRVCGTLASMQMGRGFLSRAMELRSELTKSMKLFTTEQAGCATVMTGPSAKKAKLEQCAQDLVRSLEKLCEFSASKQSANVVAEDEEALDVAIEPSQDALEAWREAGRGVAALTDKLRQIAGDLLKTARELRLCERQALESGNSIFQTVAQARFRDVDAAVRVEVARQLAVWSATYPRAMAANHRSKYLGWMLSDKNAGVRLQALHGLALVETAGLEAFVNRFAPRVHAMLNDVDDQVVAAALELCAKWVEAGLLNREGNADMLFACEELVFAEELEIASAAAKFCVKFEPKLAHEDGLVRTRTFCLMVLGHIVGEEDQAEDEEEEGELLVHLECVKAMEAFDKLCDVDSICELLGDDQFCAKSLHLPRMLCAMLHSSLVQIQEKKGGVTANAAARKLADFLIQFRTDDHCLEFLCRAIPLCRFVNPAQLERVLREVIIACTEHNDVGLLNAAAQALAQLLDQSNSAAATTKQAAKDALDKIYHVLRTSKSSSRGETAFMARCAALTIALPGAGRQVIPDEHELVDRILAHEGEMDAWLAFALQTLVFLESSGSSNAQVEHQRHVARAFAHVLALPACVERPGITNQILGLFCDARTLFWPGSEGGNLPAWIVSEELITRADALLMDMVASLDTVDPAKESLEMISNQVLAPQSRVALFASQFHDSKTPAFVLRFASFDHLPQFKQCAIKLNADLRKQDVIRWLMAHLETICLDVGYADGLVKLLGPCSQKVVQQLTKAVSIMACQAIRIAVERQDDSVLTAIAPYLAFCKEGTTSRAHIVHMWEEEVLPTLARDGEDEEEESFGAAFVERLYNKNKKKRASNAHVGMVDAEDGDDVDAEPAATPVKRTRGAGQSPKRTASTKRRAPADTPATVVTAAASNRPKPLEFKKSRSSAVELERSLFEEDDEEEEEATPMEETPMEEEEEEEIIGFRPRTTWT